MPLKLEAQNVGLIIRLSPQKVKKLYPPLVAIRFKIGNMVNYKILNFQAMNLKLETYFNFTLQFTHYLVLFLYKHLYNIMRELCTMSSDSGLL